MTVMSVSTLASLCTDFFPEDILDDGVGLISETSGDSLDDDAELFSEYRDYEKVKISNCLMQCFTAPLSKVAWWFSGCHCCLTTSRSQVLARVTLCTVLLVKGFLRVLQFTSEVYFHL